MDFVRAALVSNLFSIVVVLLTAGILAWNNASSRNIALATGTLAAAVLLFLIQIGFELRVTNERHFVTAELTIDHSEPSIRQWDYAGTTSWRISREVEASKWLGSHKPNIFSENPEKVTTDLVLFSLVSQLASTGYDWQIHKATFTGKSAGIVMTWQRMSQPSECTNVDETQLRRLLERTGNIYAEAPLHVIGGNLCLPPKTSISLTEVKLEITNPFVQLVFLLQPSGAVSYMKPGTGSAVSLPNGGSQYETRLIGIQVDINFRALRANHRVMPKYQAWTADLLRETRKWFESET